MKRIESYLCGRWAFGAGKPEIVVNPFTEEALAEVNADGLDRAAAVKYAREVGGPALRALTFGQRAELLKALSAALHEQREALIDLSIAAAGSTRGDAKFDLDGASGTLAAYASFGKKLGDRRFLSDGEGIQLGRTPRFWGQHVLVTRPGVAVHINAFNFPAWGMAEKLACSILAGVPAIEKPGTPTALVAEAAARVLIDSGILPEGALQFLGGSAGDLLDHLGPMDLLAFTGSAATGAKLKAHPKLIAHNVRVNIEADSLNSAVLAPDVDASSDAYDEFLSNVVTDITQKAGQKCTAVRRIFVPKDRVEDVVGHLIEGLKRQRSGDPAAAETRVGTLTSAGQLRDVRAGLERLAECANVRCGGVDTVRARGFGLEPTLLAAINPEADVFHELEVFGPVSTVLPYDGSAKEAVRLVNRGGGSLVASVYSNDASWTEEVVLGLAPWHGRLWIGSDRVKGQATAPGLVLPATIHGGPGRAGGGEELGGLRGLAPYLQRTAIQGFQGFVAKTFGSGETADL